jgi:hypothetical protein
LLFEDSVLAFLRPACLCREDSRATRSRPDISVSRNFFLRQISVPIVDVSVASRVIRFSIFPVPGRFPLPVRSLDPGSSMPKERRRILDFARASLQLSLKIHVAWVRFALCHRRT